MDDKKIQQTADEVLKSEELSAISGGVSTDNTGGQNTEDLVEDIVNGIVKKITKK